MTESESLIRRIGVIGDIHCEDKRLEAALRFLATHPLDMICAVGDIVDGPGDVNRTIELLIEHNVVCVRGNHERWLMNDEMRKLGDANSRFDLKIDAWEFLPSLPLTRSFETVAGPMLLCHGLGDDDMAGVYPFDDALTLHSNYTLWKLVTSGKYKYIVNGHTHRRLVRTFDNLTLINAGTIYREHDPCFCIIDFEAGHVQYFRISGEGKIDEIVKFQFHQA